MGNSDFNLLLIVSALLLSAFFLDAAHGSKKCYIVYMGAHSHGPTPTPVELEAASYSHYDLLGSVLGSHEKARAAMIYSYNRNINGFAALLEEEEASHLAKSPNVVSVFLSKEYKLQTTRSWEFLGLHRNGHNTAWQKGRFGENTIIANIDTGVWPESKSFSDKGYGAIPSKWRGGNICQINQFLGSKRKQHCNRKLIGARFFSDAFEAVYEKLDSPLRTARDLAGHGTHTLSIAGGNFVAGATVLGQANGTAKGGSPRARVASYKACWALTDSANCFGADVLSAIDRAISDGVDIISLSAAASYPVKAEDMLTDDVSIGAFHAISNNILFVASAGNDGPDPGTVSHVAPWIFTVAASTIDRDISSTITFGNNQQVTGASLYMDLPPNEAFSLILATDAKLPNATIRDALLCRPGTLDPSKVNGKIVSCLREGKIRSVTEGQEAKSSGAKGMFLANQNKNGKTFLAENQVLSTVNSAHPHSKGHSPSLPDKTPFYAITATAPSPADTVRFSPAKTFLRRRPAPVMASYSSRGPNKNQPAILKPDITAPGVNILAAYSLFASGSGLLTDTRRGFEFNVLEGTSMSCPHIAGVAGLLKTLHPNWSPAAIKSAIMTTATTRDNTNRPIQDAFDKKLATPFDYGSGHVQPDLAIDPGLVYDIVPTDYLNFLCASGYDRQGIAAVNFNKTSFICKGTHLVTDLNYPSITLPNLEFKSVTVNRTLTNVGPPGTYVATTKSDGFSIRVVPNSLSFNRIGEKRRFQVTVQLPSVIQKGIYKFGELLWTDGKHRVRSPVTVRRK